MGLFRAVRIEFKELYGMMYLRRYMESSLACSGVTQAKGRRGEKSPTKQQLWKATKKIAIARMRRAGGGTDGCLTRELLLVGS